MKRDYVHLDSDQTIFFEKQLAFLKARSFDIKFAALKARSLLPVSFEAGPGAESIVYEQFDQVGMARIIANYAKDLPRADVKGKEFTSPVKSLGASYGFNVQEIRAAAMSNKPLRQRKANAARRAVLQQENSIAYFGDSSYGLGGFFTNANIPNVALPADGAGSATTLASKTAQQMVRDLNSISNTVVTQSKGVHNPNTMLLPLAQFTLVNSTPRSDQSDLTVLRYYLQNNGFVTDAEWVNELAAANSSGNLASDTAFCYERSEDVLTLEVPQEYEEFPPQEEGLEMIINAHQRIGGVLIYYPLAITKSDDV